MPKYNTEKLEKKITEKYGTHKAFAEAAHINPATVSRRLKRGDWRAAEMFAALAALDIPLKDVSLYFFDDGRAVAQPQGVKK